MRLSDGVLVPTLWRNAAPVRSGKFRCPFCRCLVNEPTVEKIEAELCGTLKSRHPKARGVKYGE